MASGIAPRAGGVPVPSGHSQLGAQTVCDWAKAGALHRTLVGRRVDPGDLTAFVTAIAHADAATLALKRWPRARTPAARALRCRCWARSSRRSARGPRTLRRAL